MRYIITTLFIINSILVSGCGNNTITNQNTDEDQTYNIEELAKEELSEAEIEGLVFIREEEKLARDVYKHLYDIWQIRVFNNIEKSEQRHTDAIKTLLDRYEIDDPVKTDNPGGFANQDLQELYDDLIKRGESSLAEALYVGALIEEVDINDIQKELDENVDNHDILFVYDNLLNGSYNHLEAFVKNLSGRGILYAPKFLSEEKYNEIIN